MTIVNSWNEWDPLKHVIVGAVENAYIPPMEPALEPKISKDSGMAGSHGPRSKESIDKANIQLENFVKILNSLNIKVDRPTPIDFSQSIETPDWSNDGMFGCMPPRDVILTVGNEMLEAPMSYRCRWFEYLAYRPLLEKYYSEDKNMRWESAPKPRLTNQSYKSNYLPEGITEEERYKKIENRDMILTEKEPLFDAAEILRFGKDLFYHNNFTSNLSGLDWLRRHYPKKDNLYLLKVNAFKLEHLLWEQASNGDMYPHLYSPLDIANVEEEFELPLNDDGNHILPEILKKYQFSRPR